MSAADDMEQPAKRWEVASVSKAVETQAKQLNNIELKVDRLLDGQITSQAVDEKIQVLKDRVYTDIKSIYMKYDPILDNVKWLTRILIVAVVGLLINILTQLWGK